MAYIDEQDTGSGLDPVNPSQNNIQPKSVGSEGGWDANRVSEYFKSRGVTPNSTSPDYWASKWKEFGEKDPNYFMQRLSTADEFNPGGQPSGSPSGGFGLDSFRSINNGFGTDAMKNDLYSQLMARSKQGTAIDRNDPNIRQQVDPYAAQVDRERKHYLQANAERAGANANVSAETRASAEKAGQATGLFEGQLVGKELQSRRDEIQNALLQMGSMLTEDQRVELQRQLGLINANLQQQGINSGNDQFAANFGAQNAQQANYWDAIRRGLL